MNIKAYSISAILNRCLQTVIFIVLLIGLYWTTTVNYLLFHSLAEIFSIIVASSIFVIAWHSRNYIKNPYLLFIGIAYLFIGGLDLLHTLAYKGMPIFTDYDYYANQLWIAARYMESITLVLAFWFLHEDHKNRPEWIATSYAMATSLIIATIFIWKVFPVCFSESLGLTPFKKVSEYIICGILVLAISLLIKNRSKFDRGVFVLLMGSLLCTIISELAFTFYISNYGLSNLVGHYFKIFSFYLVYQALVITGIRQPLKLIFYELENTNRRLSTEVAARRETERQRERLIEELKSALIEIDALKGVLPICSFCKKIRDTKGQWQEVDQYIHRHSKADISHGICPQCKKVHYPELFGTDPLP